VNTFVAEINSLEKSILALNHVFSTNKQNAPEKKIPSTAAKAIKRSANESDSIHFKAQSAFFLDRKTLMH
jgi:hypothetical protein